MAGFLESLTPLAGLVAATADPAATCAALLAAAGTGTPDAAMQVIGGGDLVRPALRYAGLLDADGRWTPDARDRLLRLEGAVAVMVSGVDRWLPVMTVPAYLRGALPGGRVDETFPAIRDLIAGAGRRVVMASPFLDAGFEQLIPAITRFLVNGGQFLLITRDLVNPASPNARVVAVLRAACASNRNLEVVSWEEEGLGLHMKALVADARQAYVGSANFTWGGLGQHAELGIRLEGPAVAEIEHLLDGLATALRSRRRLRAR